MGGLEREEKRGERERELLNASTNSTNKEFRTLFCCYFFFILKINVVLTFFWGMYVFVSEFEGERYIV